MFNRLKQGWRDTSGSLAILFAFLTPVMLVALGGAVDVSRMLQVRSALQAACDAASLTAVSTNSPEYAAALAMSANGSVPVSVSNAQSIFAANTGGLSTVSNVAFSASVAKAGAVVTSTISATGSYRTTLLSLIGLNTMPFSVASVSSSTIPPYIDFYLLLDNSPSMGVGATTADINTMVAHTPDQCAFACHQSNAPGSDYYALAKSLGVTMRIDVVRQATQNLMSTAKLTETEPNQFRMAIYDLGASASAIDPVSPTANQVSALSSNLTASASNAAAVDLMIMPYSGYNSDRQTNFSSTLSNMNNSVIPASGTGVSATNTQKVLFLVSDGATDSYDCNYNDGGSCRRITPMDTTSCTALKNRGVRIAVLYTTYLPLPTNSFYNTYMAQYVAAPSQLSAAMQACASPGLYFEVSPSQGISDAMSALFQKVVSVVRMNS